MPERVFRRVAGASSASPSCSAPPRRLALADDAAVDLAGADAERLNDAAPFSIAGSSCGGNAEHDSGLK